MSAQLRNEDRRDTPPPATWAVRGLATLTALGAGGPLALALAGLAQPGPALGVGALVSVAGLTCLLARPRRAAPSAAVEAAPPPPPAPRSPPFDVIVELFEDPVLVVSGHDRSTAGARRYLFANAAARDLLRIQRPEGPLTTALRAPEVLAAVDEALFEGVPSHAPYQSGGVQDRVWRAQALPLGPGRPGLDPPGERLAVLCLRDETEFRRGERKRTDFLANASHELRTPLASLAGFIETLRGHARDDAVAREQFLAIMQTQAERMRSLIDDLMSLSRIELGEHIPPSGSVDLPLAVVDVLDALKPLADARSVAFEMRLPAIGGVFAKGDRDQILQVVQNLTENALKYSPPGAVVSLEVIDGVDAQAASAPVSAESAHLSLLTPDRAMAARYVLLRVRDHGPGIARLHLPRLTERFYRVEGQKRNDRQGTGLGLAIVKHIVNRHRGGLTVESTEGEGATFGVYLPVSSAPGRP